MSIAVQFEGPIVRSDAYAGTVHVASPTTTTVAFTEFAQGLIQEAFGSLDPETAQFEIPVDSLRCNPQRSQAAIHSPSRVEAFRPARFSPSAGCDPESTYFDVPALAVRRQATATS